MSVLSKMVFQCTETRTLCSPTVSGMLAITEVEPMRCIDINTNTIADGSPKTRRLSTSLLGLSGPLLAIWSDAIGEEIKSSPMALEYNSSK